MRRKQYIKGYNTLKAPLHKQIIRQSDHQTVRIQIPDSRKNKTAPTQNYIQIPLITQSIRNPYHLLPPCSHLFPSFLLFCSYIFLFFFLLLHFSSSQTNKLHFTNTQCFLWKLKVKYKHQTKEIWSAPVSTIGSLAKHWNKTIRSNPGEYFFTFLLKLCSPSPEDPFSEAVSKAFFIQRFGLYGIDKKTQTNTHFFRTRWTCEMTMKVIFFTILIIICRFPFLSPGIFLFCGKLFLSHSPLHPQILFLVFFLPSTHSLICFSIRFPGFSLFFLFRFKEISTNTRLLTCGGLQPYPDGPLGFTSFLCQK